MRRRSRKSDRSDERRLKTKARHKATDAERKILKEVFEVNFSLCGFEGVKCMRVRRESGDQRTGAHRFNSGDDSKRVPPVPIPNTEVKPLSAEGTWLATARENRTPPDSKEGIRNYPLDYN